MRRGRSALLGVALGLLGCFSAPVHTRPWLEVQTAHFRLLSPLPEREAVELARHLELFRSVFAFVTGEQIPPGRLPLRVIAFDGPTGYRPFALPGAGGYFFSTLRESSIVVGGRRAWLREREILQHEYVHYLLRSRGHFAYPPWYSEGFAEFLSSVEVGRHAIEIGRLPPERMRAFRQVGWIPLGKLISRRSLEGMQPSQQTAFYAQSWALVHYLSFGRDGADTRAELSRYLRALGEGATDEQALREGFGVESTTLGRRLREYLEAGRYPFVRVERQEFETELRPRIRRVARAEISRELASLSLALGRFELAEGLFVDALGAAPGEPRSLVGLGNALAGQGRWNEAEAAHREALAAGSDDAFVHLDYANSLHHRARESADAEARAALVRRAREHYVESWKLDDGIAETYAGYGASFLVEGEDPARGLETLEHAHRLLPSSPELKIELARLYARLGRRAEARELARIVGTWQHSEDAAEEIRGLLDELQSDSAQAPGSPP